MNTSLSPRQQQVIDLARDGLHPYQIAYRLNLAESTVKNALCQAYRRLGVHSLRELRQGHPRRYCTRMVYDTYEGVVIGWHVIDRQTGAEHGPYPCQRASRLARKWNEQEQEQEREVSA